MVNLYLFTWDVLNLLDVLLKLNRQFLIQCFAIFKFGFFSKGPYFLSVNIALLFRYKKSGHCVSNREPIDIDHRIQKIHAMQFLSATFNRPIPIELRNWTVISEFNFW